MKQNKLKPEDCCLTVEQAKELYGIGIDFTNSISYHSTVSGKLYINGEKWFWNGKLFFAVMNKDRNIEYVPMRETYKLMKEIPVDLSVLEFLLRQQSSTVIEMATESFNKDKYELITEIGIRVYKHKKNMTEYRTKKKFQKK